MDEINLYEHEEDIWKIKEGISNSSGNLALHLIGNLNYFIGTAIGHTNYTRDRDKEFSDKNIPRRQLITDIKHLITVIKKTFHKLSDEDLKHDFPMEMNSEILSIEQVMIHLLTHLNYHLGQVNYHRRMISSKY
jgi:hypothetical protein